MNRWASLSYVAALNHSFMGRQSFLKEPLKVFKSFGLKLSAFSQFILANPRLRAFHPISSDICSLSAQKNKCRFASLVFLLRCIFAERKRGDVEINFHLPQLYALTLI